MITKRCSKCLQFKPLIEFRKQYAGKYHVRADCRACETISRQEQRHNKRTQPISQSGLTCWHCGTALSLERQQRERKRMERECMQQGGIGERLPRCLDCQIKGF